ncbi:MAG: polysaccharide pyruvyl transferase family protein [Burkholderiaceae bacterium]|nr:polysaccharide pyruvyl transferase family protein [Burkholderiaceae bacterium]
MSPSPKRVAILGSAGFVTNAVQLGLGRSLEIAGANTGNFVFQLAVRQMLGDSAEVYNFALGEDPVWLGRDSLLSAVDYLVLPAANHLRQDADWDRMNDWIETIDKPFVVMGLGAQADRSGDPHSTAEALRRNASVVRMCRLLAEKSVYVGVRGEFSQEVARLLGIERAEVSGCPSFMLSRQADLGRRLEGTLARLRRQPQGVRLAMLAEAPYNIFRKPDMLATEQRLFAWIRSMQGTYIQQSGGELALEAATGTTRPEAAEGLRWQLRTMAPDLDPEQALQYLREHGRVFFSAPDWIEYMRKFDLSIGHRFHGNMATLAAGRPGVVLSHDARTSELVRLMGIPSLDSTVFLRGIPSIDEVLAAISFDAASFDRARSRLARHWIEVFGRIGIPLETHLQDIGRADGPDDAPA